MAFDSRGEAQERLFDVARLQRLQRQPAKVGVRKDHEIVKGSTHLQRIIVAIYAANALSILVSGLALREEVSLEASL